MAVNFFSLFLFNGHFRIGEQHYSCEWWLDIARALRWAKGEVNWTRIKTSLILLDQKKNWKKKTNVELLTLGSNSFVQDFCGLAMRLELVGQNKGLTGCTAK